MPIRLLALLALLCLSACAPIHAASYTPQECYQLRTEAWRAGAYRVGASAIAAGLAAGGAVVPLVGDSKGAQVGLAMGAVLFGALGLAAGQLADESQKEWVDICPYIPVDQMLPGAL